MKRETGTPPQPRQQYTIGFFDVLDRVFTFVLANLLWVFVSLPIVTMPVATAGLFAVLSPLVRGKEVEPFQAFWEAIRKLWRKSLFVFALDLIVAGLIVANISIIGRMDVSQPLTRVSQIMTLSVGLAALLVNLYIWPLMVVFDLPLRQLLETAARLAFGHLPHSLLWLVVALIPLALSLLSPALISLTVSFAGCALASNWGAWRVIRRYIAAEELARLES